ncbi:hypothetical protein LTR17_019984 [Elasticomyces elasticus]|nr:hypothetical protein LTR17_019984 [Elasticomyces elasticus]
MEDVEAGYDESVLEAKVQRTTGRNVVLGPLFEVHDFKTLDNSVVAILVDANNSPGLILVDGKPQNPTGPDKTGIKLYIFSPGQTCDIFGRPSVRRFVQAENQDESSPV